MRKSFSIFLGALAILTLAASSVMATEVAGYTLKSENASRQSLKLGTGKKAKEMLFVVDESAGEGYDIIVADTDLDGDLADEKPIEKDKKRKTTSYSYYRLEVTAPFRKVDLKAKYGLSIYVYHTRAIPGGKKPMVRVIGNIMLKSEEKNWSYMFLGTGGKPDKKDPGLTRQSLGTRVALEVKTSVKGAKLSVSAAIKDKAGQILRTASGAGKSLVPHLKIVGPTGRVVTDKDLSYG